MKIEERTDELLAPLRQGPVAMSAGELEDARSERLLLRIEAATREMPRRLARERRLAFLRRAFSTATVASSLLFASSAQERSAPEPLATRLVWVQSRGEGPLSFREEGGAEVRAIDGREALQRAGELSAPEKGGADLVTSSGAHVALSSRSRVRVATVEASRGTDELALLSGEVTCRVPKLATGQSFVVSTPAARVIVHGTRFQVRVDEANASCVRVEEGLVEVRAEGAALWLGAGASWGCQAASGARGGDPVDDVAPRPRRTKRVVHSKSSLAPKPAPSEAEHQSGTLAVETELLVEALHAEQTGDVARARELFAELRAAYPRSPLVPEAQRGLLRLGPQP